MAASLNPWALFGATFLAGLLAQMVFPRQRWSVALVVALGPLAFLTATIWWRIWEHDALYIIAYFVALMICGGGSISGLLMADIGRRKFRN